MPNKKALVPLLLAVFVDLVGFSIVLPVLPGLFLDTASGILPAVTPYATRAILLGLLLGLYPLIQIFTAPILGALADRHGRKPVLVLSFLGTLTGYLLFGFGVVTHSLWMLVVGRVIDGATGGNVSVAQAAIADLSDAKSRAKNFGLIGVAFGLGFIVGPYLGGKLSDPSLVSWFSYATPFWFSAALCAFNTLLLMAWLPETLKARRHRPIGALTGIRNIAKAFTMPRMRLLFLVMLLLTLGFTLFTSYFQVYLIDRFHLGQSTVGDVFGYVGLWIAFAQGVVVRPVADRLRADQVLRFAPVGLAAALWLLLAPHSLAGLFYVLPLTAIFQGLVTPNITSLISESADASSQGEILGINQSVVSLAQFLPGLFGGATAAIYSGAPILLAVGLTLVAWLVFVVWYRHTPATPFHETA